MLTTKEIANKCGYRQCTVQKWIRDGLLPGQKLGGLYLVDAKDLVNFKPPVVGRPKKAGEIK